LRKMIQNRTYLTTALKQCSITMKPGRVDIFDMESDKFIQIGIFIGEIQNDLIYVANLNGSFRINPLNMQKLHSLEVSLSVAKITAGYSSSEWAHFFESEETNSKPTSVHTPYVKIDEFKISITVKGKMLSSGAELNARSFLGNAETTTKDLKSYYSGEIMRFFPSFLSNTELLGTNVLESSFQRAGAVCLGSNVVGSGLGSATGTVVLDGIKSAVASGKGCRNANVNDKYQFGDFTRGVMCGVRESLKEGAQMRGGDESEYIPGDLTAGAISGVAEYAGKNKTKLVTSAGSGSAAMIGLAVAGPLGFVAGSHLGGKAVGSLFREDDGKTSIQNQMTTRQGSLESTYSNTNAISSNYIYSSQYPGQRQQQQQHKQVTTCQQSQANQQQYSHSSAGGHSQAKSQNYNLSATVQHQYQCSHHDQSTASQSTLSQNGFLYKHPQAYTQNKMNTRQQLYSQPQNRNQHIQQQKQQKSYEFGDFTKNIIAKGKKSDGRSETDGYKFGKKHLHQTHTFVFTHYAGAS